MITFENVYKKYNTSYALKNISLTINDGEFICVIGTSGSGKTTLMRMINHMIEPTSGTITINNKNILDYNEVELRRKIGYVIQNIGLFPHMTIKENIMLVPNLLKWNEQKKAGIAEDLMKKVDLPLDYLNKKPRHLSGGQQQRVGVIRSLAANQQIILMDEPFGALDNITRESLQSLIKNIQQEMNKTIVFVTHDIDEAIKLSDRIIVMHQNEIVQFDTPKEIITRPANEFVQQLIGQSEDLIHQSNSPEIHYKDPLISIIEKIKNIPLTDESITEQIYPIIDLEIKDDDKNKLTKKIVLDFLLNEFKYVSIINDSNEIVGAISINSQNQLLHKDLR
ncbi:ABC transporter ATP-binding protein [Vagococcus fluvialis]|nr:ABC transporter ATP-binding protein [Vagococcus fluvialis]MBO0428082.1 ABC transporter ATP-binding protein [Vagococcus fluvialis]